MFDEKTGRHKPSRYRIFGRGLFCKYDYWRYLYGTEPPKNWRVMW